MPSSHRARWSVLVGLCIAALIESGTPGSHNRRVPVQRLPKPVTPQTLRKSKSKADHVVHGSIFEARLRAIESAGTAEELLSVAWNHSAKDCTLDVHEVCATLTRLKRIDRETGSIDASGRRLGGINQTSMMYHKPYSQFRAALMKRTAAVAPLLSPAEAVRVLDAVSTLQRFFRSSALLLPLSARALEVAGRLSAGRVACMLDHVAAVAVDDQRLFASLATRARAPDVWRSMQAKDLARIATAIAALKALGLAPPALLSLLNSLLEKACEEKAVRLGLRGKVLGEVVIGVGRVRAAPREAIRALARAATSERALNGLGPAQLCAMAWAFASLSATLCPRSRRRRALRTLANATLHSAYTPTPQDAVMLLWALHQGGVGMEEAVAERLCGVLLEQRHRLTAHSLAHALAALASPPEPPPKNSPAAKVIGALGRRAATTSMRAALLRLAQKWEVDVEHLSLSGASSQRSAHPTKLDTARVVADVCCLARRLDRPVLPALPKPISAGKSRARFDAKAEVRGVLVLRPRKARSLLQSQLHLSERAAEDLLSLGAVWLDSDRLGREEDVEVRAGGFLFAYVQPRRFPVALSTDWRARIVFVDADCCIVNKPGGVPSLPRADNSEESCAACVQRALGAPVMALHRLDLPTHGLLAFARSSPFKSHFYQQMRDRRVKKQYQALLASRPSEGDHVHRMLPSTWAPKVLRAEGQAPLHWLTCHLKVLGVRVLQRDALTPAAQLLLPAAQQEAFEADIDLMTGRTHQIRAQLAFEGHPILGDQVYQNRTENNTHALSLSNRADSEQEGAHGAKDAAWEERGLLCLQAMSIRFAALPGSATDGGSHASGKERVFELDHAWWRAAPT